MSFPIYYLKRLGISFVHCFFPSISNHPMFFKIFYLSYYWSFANMWFKLAGCQNGMLPNTKFSFYYRKIFFVESRVHNTHILKPTNTLLVSSDNKKNREQVNVIWNFGSTSMWISTVCWRHKTQFSLFFFA